MACRIILLPTLLDSKRWKPLRNVLECPECLDRVPIVWEGQLPPSLHESWLPKPRRDVRGMTSRAVMGIRREVLTLRRLNLRGQRATASYTKPLISLYSV